MASGKYRIRYLIEEGQFDRPDTAVRVAPGVSSSGTDYGYADDLFVVSEAQGPDGSSLLCLCTHDRGAPSKATVERMIKYLQHYRDNHAE